ncbi:hypothetical protein [Sphingomonas sp.]|uniref:tetratricopeptide repeat protein n=1 Tax=Sphingomonas sp. TaxID=28214 RepID=UPI002E14F412
MRQAGGVNVALPRPTAARIIAAGVLVAVALFALARIEEHWRAPPTSPPLAVALRQYSYVQAKSGLDAEIIGARSLAANREDDWLTRERLALLLMDRARLTGDFTDLLEAQRSLDRGFAAAPEGSGPHMTAAILALSEHRLDTTERLLASIDRYAVEPDPKTRSAQRALRGDVAFYRGRYRAALVAYAALPQPDYRLAIFRARTGQPDMALDTIGRIERTALHTGHALAQLALLRGTIQLQRGDWDAAEASFVEADRRFPGWWLAAAHRAQMLALRGQQPAAIRAFKALAGAHGDPMLRDALASLYRASGDYAQSRAWAEQAAQGWAERLRLLPDAALGHAAEHELAFGTPERALMLASRDFDLRPHGATAITLAWALIANNRPADALRLMERVNRSSWSSAEQHLVAARAHALLGHGEAAAEAEKRALAINPRALDASAATLWFGH